MSTATRPAESGLSRSIERSIERDEGDRLFGDATRGSTSNIRSSSGGKGSSKSRSGTTRHNQLLDFDGASFQTLLKLRKQVQLKPRLTADLGLNLNPVTRHVLPLGCLSYQLRKDDPDFATLRISHRHAVIVKTFDVNLDRAKIPLSGKVQTAAGFDWQGTPSFSANVGDVRPKWVPVVAAVVMLALQQPLAGSRHFGNVVISNPVNGTAMGEAFGKIKLSDDESGLSVKAGQLNLVMRF